MRANPVWMKKPNNQLNLLGWPKNKREKLTRDKKNNNKLRKDLDNCRKKERLKSKENRERRRKGRRGDWKKRRKIESKENSRFYSNKNKQSKRKNLLKISRKKKLNLSIKVPFWKLGILLICPTLRQFQNL